MYDIGIIGGMGPQSTATLFERIIKHTEAEQDQSHPDIIILNQTKTPDRTEFIIGNSKVSPLKDLEKCIDILNHVGVKQVIMPCNTAHYFYDELQNMSSAPILNMVNLTLEYVASCSSLSKTVCILATQGTIKAKIYEKMNHINLEIVYPDDSVCDDVHKIINGVKNTNNADEIILSNQLTRVMDRVRCQNRDVTFVLACTELSVLDKNIMNPYEVVDAMDVLALSSIYMAGYKWRLDGMNYDEEILKKILEKR